MRNNRILFTVALSLLITLAVSMPTRAAEPLSTLFTTPQERELINANRYRTEEDKPQVIEEEEIDELPLQVLVRETVNVSYRISGISLSNDGRHSAWIDSQVYQDGETLADGSRLRIMDGQEVRVRITAPDGEHYYGKSGETVELSYMAVVDN